MSRFTPPPPNTDYFSSGAKETPTSSAFLTPKRTAPQEEARDCLPRRLLANHDNIPNSN